MRVTELLSSRFLTPYYLIHLMTFAAFAGFRFKIEPVVLMEKDFTGFTREFTVWLSFGLMVFTRVFSAPTADAMVAHTFKVAKLAMMFCLYYMSPPLMVSFGAIWAAMFALFPQPRAKDPSVIEVLNRGNFNQKVAENQYKGYYVVQFHATWSPLCTQLAPLFASIATDYSHYRMKFGKVDVSLWPDLAQRYDINISGSSKQIPSYIVFKIGEEVARYPSITDSKTVMEDVSKANRSTLMNCLDIVKHHEQAEAWEAEARKMLEKQRRKNKTN